ncbi:MAG: hypothetical protein ACI39U_03830, partial [Candidatus Cryptobacteroides sp.]
MKKSIFFAALIAVTTISCNKENAEVGREIVALSFETNSKEVSEPGTRTVLNGNVQTFWNGEEKMSLFDGVQNALFTASVPTPSANATFSGKAYKSESYIALYPYNETATLTDGIISTSIPTFQKAVLGSFDPAAALLVGQTSSSELVLTNICAFLKITIPSDKYVDAIEISGNGTGIAGDISINVNSRSVSGATSDYVRIANEDNSKLNPGTYYAVIAPGTLGDGVAVTLHNSEAWRSYTKETVESRTLVGNRIYDMKTVDGDWMNYISIDKTMITGSYDGITDVKTIWNINLTHNNTVKFSNFDANISDMVNLAMFDNINENEHTARYIGPDKDNASVNNYSLQYHTTYNWLNFVWNYENGYYLIGKNCSFPHSPFLEYPLREDTIGWNTFNALPLNDIKDGIY